jgi:hypothetical protein
VHNEEINEYPEDLKAEYLRLSDWVRKARKAYGNRVVIRILDPQSLAGFWKLITHRIRRYPTFLVDGGERVVGWEGDPDGALGRALARQSGAVPQEART